ncbi:MAG: tetratricopeptide repeat protein [Terracidiphilus sp.]|jgi:predicted negative regulator of RcsB-dependent stress response
MTRILCIARHNVHAESGVTIAEWPETPTWKTATVAVCVALVCATTIGWQAHRAKANDQKLAEDARAFRVRADQGDPKAESSLAYLYSHGQGVPQDYSEALRWRRKAADQGYADGEVGLGYMYSHGLGVPQDYAEALLWYRKAADQGNPNGQNALALMFEQGLGVSQDYAQALRWYRKAVNQGYAAAEYNLGNMYYYGHGVPQDQAEAIRWYQKAADHGDEYAQRILHIKWKGMSTPIKIGISVTFLGSLVVLVGSLMPRGSFRGRHQRTFTLAGLFGLSYVALDLYGFRYIGFVTPVLAVGAFQFVKSLLSGTLIALILSALLSNTLWPKVAKILLSVNGLLLIGLDVFMISTDRLRHLVPTLRTFWSINGRVLGTLVALAIVFWLTNRNRKEDGSEIVESLDPVPALEEEP